MFDEIQIDPGSRLEREGRYALRKARAFHGEWFDPEAWDPVAVHMGGYYVCRSRDHGMSILLTTDGTRTYPIGEA
jgi:hypothetical protein